MSRSDATRSVLLIACLLLAMGSPAYAQSAITADGVIESSSGGFKYPDGSIQATATSQDEVRTPISSLPFVITDPGSYYLTSGLAMTSGGTAIDVVSGAGDVTIDLMGFDLAGDGLAQIGIDLTGASNVEIKNGIITDFTDYGVYVDPGVGGDHHRLIDVRLSLSSTCVSLDGVGNIIHRNTLTDCSSVGIRAGWYSSVVGNNVDAGGIGIYVQGNSTVEDNVVAAGTGIATDQHGTKIRDNTVSAGQYGIRVGLDSLVEGNQVTDFNTVGIEANSGNVVQGNSVLQPNSASTTCFDFTGAGNYYANNRARTCTTAYNENSMSQRDGGGNWDGTVP